MGVVIYRLASAKEIPWNQIRTIQQIAGQHNVKWIDPVLTAMAWLAANPPKPDTSPSLTRPLQLGLTVWNALTYVPDVRPRFDPTAVAKEMYKSVFQSHPPSQISQEFVKTFLDKHLDTWVNKEKPGQSMRPATPVETVLVFRTVMQLSRDEWHVGPPASVVVGPGI